MLHKTEQSTVFALHVGNASNEAKRKEEEEEKKRALEEQEEGEEEEGGAGGRGGFRIPPIPDLSRRILILPPPQRDPIARMEREDDVVRHVRHAAASVRSLADGVVELGAVAHVGGGGAVAGAFVVDHDLSKSTGSHRQLIFAPTKLSFQRACLFFFGTHVFRDGGIERVEAAGGEGVEPALGDALHLVVLDAGAAWTARCGGRRGVGERQG